MPIDLAVITTETSGCRCIVTVTGEVDLLNAGDLEQRIAATLYDVPNLVIDLNGVTYLDSAALHMLERMRRRCDEGHVRLSLLCRPQSRARRVLDLSGMTALFDVLTSLDATESRDS